MLNKLRSSRFVRDSAILQGSGGIVSGCQVLTSVLLASQLGSDGMGLHFTAVKIYALYFMLLNVGIASAAISQIGGAVTRGQSDKIADWQAFTVKSYVLIGVFLFVAGFWVLPSLVPLVTDEAYEELGRWAWWLCLSPLFDIGRVLAQITFQGTRRMAYLARLEVGTEVGRLSLIAFAVFVFGTPQAAVLATLFSCLIGSAIGLSLYRRAANDGQGTALPSLGTIASRVRAVPLRVGMRLGIRLGLLRSIDALAFDVFPPLVLFVLGVHASELEQPERWVAYFSMAQRFMMVPAVLLSGVARTALPALSGVAGLKDPEAFRRGFIRISVFGGLISLVGIVAALFALPYLLWFLQEFFWLPNDYSEPVNQLAWILAIGYALKGFSGGLETFYIVANRLRVTLVITTVSMMMAMPMLVYLTLKLPTTGPAWSINANYGVVFLHLAYIVWFFRSGQYRSLFRDGSSAPVASAPAVKS